ncbi:MAG: lipoate--protein ligase [Bacilli bacterium]|nr:lipoate--protein ligase [Bacilli bacterium]
MKSLNLKPYGKNEISFYLAVEEYLLSTCQEDVFFLWDLQKSIIIGRNQLLAAEVNVDYANKLEVKIYRRPSGGGAIFADEGCFMFSFVSKVVSKAEAFKKYLDLMVNAFKKLGLEVYFSGRNDLMFREKKFSGNAYYQNENGSVLHGTFLFATNLEDLVKAITPDNEKLISKGIKSVYERVINIGEHLSMTQSELMDYLLEKISESEKMFFLSELDYQKIKQLEKKYKEPSWIYGQDPPFTFQNENRFPWGKITIYIDVKKNKVTNLDIKGDFLLVEDLEEFKKAFIGEEFTCQAFTKILEKKSIDEYIMNSTNEQFLNLIFEEEFCGKHS